MLVREIFPTIQGEGPNTGHPAIFIRLAGCPLRCTFCDTDFRESESREMSAREVLTSVQDHSGIRLVVITGGEPLAQPLLSLLPLLSGDGYAAQIETSGIVHQGLPAWVQVVISPKTPKINYLGHVTAWKYVVKAGMVSAADGLPLFDTQGGADGTKLIARPFHTSAPIYVQPCDESDPVKNRANLDQCLDSVRRFGYRLSLQTHKIIGVP